ncbi:MAG: alpha/beta hydrolase [Steroidobacteraceae bacterium]|jgi:pimeloyl-ACP methyl ester carboxylesterase|nr:alpha/beta hydrolase [Steroidobacteraceae bacterium]
MADAARLVFVHGLWMSGVESRWLRRRLESGFGFETETFGYRTVSEPLEQVLEGLRQVVCRTPGRTVHLVGHSLGGLVCYRLFERYRDLPPGRAVFLGSPLCGSLAARGLERFGLARRLMGGVAMAELLGECERRWTADRELGLIAGTRGVGLGRFFAGFAEPNDGTVAVRETRLEGATDHLLLPVSHMGMLLSARVADECGRFLRDGRFSLRG